MSFPLGNVQGVIVGYVIELLSNIKYIFDSKYCQKLLAKDFFRGSPMNISRGCASNCHDAAFNEWITTAGCRAMNCTGRIFCCNDRDRCNSANTLDSGISSTPTKLLELAIFIILIITILSMSGQ